jgi:hypothetical protein
MFCGWTLVSVGDDWNATLYYKEVSYSIVTYILLPLVFYIFNTNLLNDITLRRVLYNVTTQRDYFFSLQHSWLFFKQSTKLLLLQYRPIVYTTDIYCIAHWRETGVSSRPATYLRCEGFQTNCPWPLARQYISVVYTIGLYCNSSSLVDCLKKVSYDYLGGISTNKGGSYLIRFIISVLCVDLV